MKHYSLHELSMFINGEMNFLSEFFCKRHLGKCRLCRSTLRNSYRNERIILEIKHASKHLNMVVGKMPDKDAPSGMFSEIDNNSSSW